MKSWLTIEAAKLDWDSALVPGELVENDDHEKGERATSPSGSAKCTAHR